MQKVSLYIFLCLLLLSSCQTNSCRLEPNICYIPPKQFIENKTSAFPPLDPEERRQEWAKELVIANAFAGEADFYRAITGYKRALFLTSKKYPARRLQMHYGIIQSYYLSGRYQDAIETFEACPLVDCPPDFPPLDDLLIILYDAYKRTENEAKASRIYSFIEARTPARAQQLRLSESIRNGDLNSAVANIGSEQERQDVWNFVNTYQKQGKSIKKAQFLNAVLPGAGYLYVGQKVSAITSLWLNSLFIAAAYYCFNHHNIAAGLIFSSFEFGWYFGGINGAGLAAKEYNEHLYNTHGKELMLKDSLFPVLMLRYTF